MKKIQLIGLPGAGKTTAIHLYNEQHPDHMYRFLDIVDYLGPHKEYKFLSDIKTETLDTVAESACGVYYYPTINVQINPSIDVICRNLKTRGEDIDIEYLAGLKRQMISSHYTIRSSEELIPLLATLFKR